MLIGAKTGDFFHLLSLCLVWFPVLKEAPSYLHTPVLQDDRNVFTPRSDKHIGTYTCVNVRRSLKTLIQMCTAACRQAIPERHAQRTTEG